MTIERINELFENSFITAEEHNELIMQTQVKVKERSRYSSVSLFLALVGYICMLTFQKNGNEFALLSDGDERLWAGGIFSVAALITFLIDKAESKNKNLNSNYAYVGLGITIAILLIVVPVMMMLL